MESKVDPAARTVIPDGLPLAILVLSSVLLGLSISAVSLRSYIRLVKGTFGLDDTFMVAGCVGLLTSPSRPSLIDSQVVYTTATGLTIYGVLVGLGRLSEDLNLWQQSEAMKYYIIWILTYVLALATVKSSICITILRIASTKINLRITVYVLLAVTWASFFITFIGTLLYCRPVRAIWTPTLILSGEGTCAPVSTLVIIGHVATVSTIATDLALVVVPAIILWNTQMKRQAKVQAFGLLSFASVASIITMVRIPYVNKFEGMTDLPCKSSSIQNVRLNSRLTQHAVWVAHTMLCSNIETGIGCIASSVPSLRHFLRRNGDESSSGGPSAGRPSGGIKTISQQRVRRPEDNWEVLQDGDSDRSVAPIHPKGVQQRAYEMDIEMKGLERDSNRTAYPL
jgi:hypothetical protein